MEILNMHLTDALAKLGEAQVKEVKGREAQVMAGPVAEALRNFCRQNGAFARAVAQGGSFADCMAAVSKGVGQSISDVDAKIAELQMQLATTAGGSSQGAYSSELAINEIKTVVAELQTAANKLHGCYIKHRAANPKLAASVQSMVEKMISNLYYNFGIDPI